MSSNSIQKLDLYWYLYIYRGEFHDQRRHCVMCSPSLPLQLKKAIRTPNHCSLVVQQTLIPCEQWRARMDLAAIVELKLRLINSERDGWTEECAWYLALLKNVRIYGNARMSSLNFISRTTKAFDKETRTKRYHPCSK